MTSPLQNINRSKQMYLQSLVRNPVSCLFLQIWQIWWNQIFLILPGEHVLRHHHCGQSRRDTRAHPLQCAEKNLFCQPGWSSALVEVVESEKNRNCRKYFSCFTKLRSPFWSLSPAERNGKPAEESVCRQEAEQPFMADADEERYLLHALCRRPNSLFCSQESYFFLGQSQIMDLYFVSIQVVH